MAKNNPDQSAPSRFLRSGAEGRIRRSNISPPYLGAADFAPCAPTWKQKGRPRAPFRCTVDDSGVIPVVCVVAAADTPQVPVVLDEAQDGGLVRDVVSQHHEYLQQGEATLGGAAGV